MAAFGMGMGGLPPQGDPMMGGAPPMGDPMMGGAPPMGAPMGAGFLSLDPMALAQQVAMILSQIAQGDAAMFQAQQDQAMQQASPLVMAMLGQQGPMADPSLAPPADPSMMQAEPLVPEDNVGML